MTSIADGAVIIQTSAESVPSTPSWFGEVALMATYRRRAQCSDKDQRGGALCTTAVRALPRGTTPGPRNDYALLARAHQLPQARALLRLDGPYCTGNLRSDLSWLPLVTP